MLVGPDVKGTGIQMIKPTDSGYQVTSESGKPLSKPNLSKEGAKRRLRQVDYFKHQASQRKDKKD